MSALLAPVVLLTLTVFGAAPAARAAQIFFNNSTSATFGVGEPSTLQLVVSGATQFTVTSGTLPPWASLNPSTGLITGTPPNASVPSYNFGVTATNGSGASIGATFTINVSATSPSAYVYSTLSGTPAVGSTTDAIPSAARFNRPNGTAVDASGNVYVADRFNHTIRKISAGPNSIVTTLAGAAGQTGFADGAGAAARFNDPLGIAIDAFGTLYIADAGNHAIRKISAAGVVSTFAGDGVAGSSNSTGATSAGARFNRPAGVAVDSSLNVYVADTDNNTIRKITPPGRVSTFAGLAGSFGAVDGTVSSARFASPRGVAVDASGTIFVADSSNGTIRRINEADVATAVTTVAGAAGVGGGSTDGTGAAARFSNPTGVVVDGSGNLFVTDMMNGTIRKIAPGGVVTTLAGLAGTRDLADGTGSAARFGQPEGLAIDSGGNLFVADELNHAIRKVTTAGVVTTYAGLPPPIGGIDANSANGFTSRFYGPVPLAVDGAGTIFVADAYRHLIRKVGPDGRAVSLAGEAGTPGSTDGTLANARFRSPNGIAVAPDGTIYVADTDNSTIRKISTTGIVSTFAGQAGSSGTADGTGATARFFNPYGVAVDGAGNVFVADTVAGTIRKITPAGVVTTLAGQAFEYGIVDATGAAARFQLPFHIAVDGAGNLYVTEQMSSVVRKVTPAGVVTTLAGLAFNSGDQDGTGSSARFMAPTGIVADAAGNVFVSDGLRHNLRRITPAGVVTTIGGAPGGQPFNGSADGVGSAARFYGPSGLGIDAIGRLFIADTGNWTIRKGVQSLPPPNDNFANAQVLTGDRGTVAGSMDFATAEGSEPPIGASGPGRSVWYRWTPTQSGNVTFDTTGSFGGFSVDLAIYVGNSPIALTPAATGSTNNAPDAPASITLPVTAGTTYRIGASTRSANFGTLLLNWKPQPPPAPTGFAATDRTVANAVQLTWGAVAGADHYEVWRHTANNSAAATQLSANVSGVSFTDSTATAGTNYFYWVKAVNADGTSGFSLADAGSHFGSLTVATIGTAPQNQTLVTGQGIALNVAATGSGTLSYQWRRDGLPIPGATGTSFTTSPATLLDAGRYDVVVTNAAGPAVSPAALVQVAPTQYPTAVHVDSAFAPMIESSGGYTSAIVRQSDGKYIVAGRFSRLNGVVRRNIARVDANGTVDPSFNPGAGSNDLIQSLAVQSNGQILIAGQFTSYNGIPRRSLARLNADGSLDAAFNSGAGVNGDVNDVTLQPNGGILIVGSFKSCNGVARIGIARLNSNGSLDTTFDPGLGIFGVPLVVRPQPDGRMLVGGDFESYNGVAVPPLVRINDNGSRDASFNPSMANMAVFALAVQPNGKIIVSGNNFTTGPKLLRLEANGTVDGSFTPATGLDSAVGGIALQSDGRILVGGSFTVYNGVTRNRIARLNADGTLDVSFDPGAGLSDYVRSLVVETNGRVVVAGGFSAVGGVTQSGIARLLPSGERDATLPGMARMTARVFAMLRQPDGKVVIGGEFEFVNDVARGGIARFDANGILDPNYAAAANGGGANLTVRGLKAQPDGKLIAVGDFSTMGGAARSGVARLLANGANDATFVPPAASLPNIGALDLQGDGKILVAGTFDYNVSGVTRRNLARLQADGALDAGFDVGTPLDGRVESVIWQPDDQCVLIGGWFTAVGGVARRGVARLLTTGALDATFNPGTGVDSGGVLTLLQALDGKIYASGIFANFNGEARPGLVRLGSSGTVDSTYLPVDSSSSLQGPVRILTLQPDGKLIASRQVGSASSRTTDLVRLTLSGAVDSSFLPSGLTSANTAKILMLEDGRLLVAGAIFSDGTINQAGLARLGPPTAPVFTNPPVAAVMAGFSATTVVSTAAAPLATYSATSLPPWASLNATTGVLTLTPTPGISGNFPVVITATNGAGVPATQNFSLTIIPPIISSLPTVRVLALSGDPAPDGDGTLQPIGIFALTEGAAAFSTITVGNAGGTANDSIIATATRLGVRNVFREGDAAPGGGNFGTNMGQISLNPSGRVAFYGYLTNTAQGSLDSEGIFSGTNASIIQIARANQTEPQGGPGVFNSFGVPGINSAGQVVFSAAIRNVGTPLPETWGIFVGNGGAPTQIARSFTPAPGGMGEFRNVNGGVTISETGEVLFTARVLPTSGGAFSALFRGNGSTPVVTIAREDDPVPEGNGRLGALNNQAVLNRDNKVAFLNILRSPSAGPIDDRAIYVGTGGPLTKIVRTGDVPPDGVGQFYDVGNISMNAQGDVAYLAEIHNAPKRYGIFWGNGTETRVIARSGDRPPEGGSTYTDFLGAAINDSRAVVFQANLSFGADYRGIYVGDGTETMLVARVGDQLLGSTITYLGFDPKAYNNARQLVFQAILANGKWGAFLFSPRILWRVNGNGEWDDAVNWTVSLRPGDYTQVEIDPATGGLVTGPEVAETVRTLRLGGATSGTAELNLQATGPLTVLEGATIGFGGKLTGAGVLVANVTNQGTVAPGNSPGVLRVEGNYNQTGIGSLNLQIGGTDSALYDQLVATGTVDLAGTINVELIGGYAPAASVVTLPLIRGQTIRLTNPTIRTPAGYIASHAIVNVSGGQVFELTLTPAVPPAIATAPADQTIVAGQGVTFSVVANSPVPATYQWLRNGFTIPGATGASLALTAVPLDGGAFFSVAVTNTYGTTVSSAARLRVNPPTPVITSPLAIVAVAGVPFVYQVTTSAPVSSYSATGLGSLSLGTVTGVLTGTLSTPGPVTIPLTATNPTGSDTRNLVITVRTPPPVLTSPAMVRGRVGTPFSFTFTAINGPVTFAIVGAIPGWMTFDPVTGTLSGPQPVAGAYNIGISATNATGANQTSLLLVIDPSQTAPVFMGATNASGTPQLNGVQGTPLNITLPFANSPTAFTATGLPAGLGINPTTGAITGTPTVTGSFSVQVTAENDAHESTQVALNLTINPPTGAPLITSASTASATAGANFTFTVTSNTTGATFSASGLPGWLTLNASTGLLEGSPPAAATVTLQLRATVGAATGPSSALVISIRPAANAPVGTTVPVVQGRVGQQLTLTLTASNSPTSFAVVNGPAPAGLQLTQSTGAITWTPTIVGPQRVWFAASNAAGTSLAFEVLFNIAPVANAPTITSSGEATARVGQPFQYVITATNSPNGYGSSPLPDGLTCTGNIISGIPATLPLGPIVFSVSASNGNGVSAPKNVTLTILPAVGVAVVTSPAVKNVRVGVAFTHQFAATGNPSSWLGLQVPNGLTLDPASGLLSGTPTVAGVFVLQVRASNDAGLGASQAFQLLVAPAIGAPVITSPAATGGVVGTNMSYTVAASPGPITSFSLSPRAPLGEALGRLPAGLAFNTTTGLLSGRPAESGSFIVEMTATNAGGTSAPQPLFITIAPAANVPVITSPLYALATVGEDFTYRIAATGVPASPTPFPPPLELDALNLPDGLAVDPATGLIQGKPTTAGVFIVSLLGTNSAGTGPMRNLVITIRPALAAPVISSPPFAVGQVGVAFSHELTATNTPIAFEASGAPAWLSLNGATGVLTGTPTAPGRFTLQVTALNAAGASSPATLALQIAAAANTPVIVSSQNATGQIGAAFSYTIGVNPAATSFASSELPGGLTLDSGTGIISGTPTVSGRFEIELTATNANGASPPVTLILVINSSLQLVTGP